MTCSSTIVVQHLEHLQRQVEKVLQVHPLGAPTDPACLFYLMAARPLQTRHLQGSERNRPAQVERSEVRPITLAYFAARFAAINSRTNLTGCVTRSLFISTWRAGCAHRLEGLWYCHQPVVPIVPIAISWIQHWSTLSNTTMDSVSNERVRFGEKITYFSICAFFTTSTLFH